MHGEMTPTSIVASMVLSTLFKWIGVVARASMAMLDPEFIGLQMGLYVENSNENEVTESEDDNEKEDGKRWRRKIEEVKGKQ